MNWLVAAYHPVSFFSLRPAHATASGGQTLLAPTAFALKMALLSVSIQTAGLAEGQSRFPAIRDLRLAVRPPDTITVLKSFAKVRRPYESKTKKSDAEAVEKERVKIVGLSQQGHYPFVPTIAYRELVQFGDPLETPSLNLLRICCAPSDGAEPPAWLAEALLAINYLGKRGGFLQLIAPPAIVPEFPDGFTELTADSTDFAMHGTLQTLDDFDPTMTFDHANIYSGNAIRLGKERVLRHVVLPYRLSRSSRGYSHSERISA